MNTAPEPPKPHAVESVLVIFFIAVCFATVVALVIGAYE